MWGLMRHKSVRANEARVCGDGEMERRVEKGLRAYFPGSQSTGTCDPVTCSGVNLKLLSWETW